MSKDILLGLVGLVFILGTPTYLAARMCLKIVSTTEQRKMTGIDVLKACIPFYNLQWTRESLYSVAPIYKCFTIASAVIWIFGLICRFIIGFSSSFGIFINLIATLLLLVDMLLLYIEHVYMCFDMSREYKHTMMKSWCWLPPYSEYLANTAIVNYCKQHPAEAEGVFDEF